MELLAVQSLVVTSTVLSLQIKTQRTQKGRVLTPGPAKPEPLQPPSSGMGGRETCFNVYSIACTAQHIQMYPGAAWRMELKRGVRDGARAQGVGSVHRSFASKLLRLMRLSKGSPVCGIESWSTRRTPRACC
ncbi:hypothetical protein M441DRAFT_376519 [Trichoderma asperellum CBS 433.97]|uniref:Uncharacterized protein n=1 Tax=Trichoderma asperellum (strain ATCC 204424 / CBS 433.97 / NBRC 101777) TaxID=1042311 RepID=A0A2T3ZFR0_TRIA4|nr:hypothetical protein M441DRAFT_376519 [Trichoderma asperellum CBS 433.97]PTB43648.1 hypothetical protein M441DRAFT_376519 [Trichoderma asperellum CBS 433.97]